MALAREGKRLNDQLSELQMKGDIFTKQMVMERKRVFDLTDAIAQADKQIVQFQKGLQSNAVDVLNLHSFSNKKMTTADGWNPSLQGIVSQKKMVTILENRLNKLLMRLSQYDHENRQIKADIDQLRRKRLACNNNRRELEIKLKDVQERVAIMLDTAAQTSEFQRVAIDNRSKLIAENKEESERFEEGYVRLGDYIDNQLKVFEESIQTAAKEVKAQVEGLDTTNVRGNLTMSDEEAMEARIKDLAVIIDNERRTAKETQERIDTYERDFQLVRQAAKEAAVATGMSAAKAQALDDINEMKNFYLRITDETFSLFTYNLEQIKERDATLERLEMIESEHEKYERDMATEDAARAEIISRLHATVKQTKEQTGEYMESAEAAQKTIDVLGKKVQGLFYKIQCDQVGKNGPNKGQKSESQLLLAAGGGGVNETNILKFLEIIEQRAVELMTEYTRRVSAQAMATAPGSPASSQGLMMMLPCPSLKSPSKSIRDTLQPPDSRDDDLDDVVVESDKPLPVSLLRQRTAEVLMQSGGSLSPEALKQSAGPMDEAGSLSAGQ